MRGSFRPLYRHLFLAAALAVFVPLALLLRLGPFAFAMVGAEGVEAAAIDGAPFSERGAHAVGIRGFEVDGDPPISGTMWYPAAPAGGDGGMTTYAYELKLFSPVGTVAIATHEGRAIRRAAHDLASGPRPLVILSPGFAIGSGSYAWLAEHLASHGLVVVSPEHDEELNPSTIWRSTITRPRDLHRLLDDLDRKARRGGALAGLVDTQRVAVIGHSYGGYTALAAAGARLDTRAFEARCRAEYRVDGPNSWLCDALLPQLPQIAELAGLDGPPSGLWPAWGEPRVDAIVSMAGDAYLFDRAGLAAITVPVLAIGGTADSDTPYTWGTEPTYAFTSGPRKAKVALTGARHMIFTGPCDRVRRIVKIVPGGFCSDAGWDRQRAQALVRHFTTAFLLAELDRDQAAAAALAPDGAGFRDITYEAEGY